jgi:hypothetical protein
LMRLASMIEIEEEEVNMEQRKRSSDE